MKSRYLQRYSCLAHLQKTEHSSCGTYSSISGMDHRKSNVSLLTFLVLARAEIIPLRNIQEYTILGELPLWPSARFKELPKLTEKIRMEMKEAGFVTPDRTSLEAYRTLTTRGQTIIKWGCQICTSHVGANPSFRIPLPYQKWDSVPFLASSGTQHSALPVTGSRFY